MVKASIALIVAFAVAASFGPAVIPLLLRLKIGQTIRSEGPESHLKKNGTPTMGGVLILAAFLVVSLIFIKDSDKILPIVFLTVGFGIVGFIDDFIKVVLKRSMGLRAWQKMGLQILITGAFAAYMYFWSDVPLDMIIPFSGGKELHLANYPWFTIPLLFFVVLGTDTGANFTDGLDGLASKVTAVIAMFFAVVSLIKGGGTEIPAAAMIGGLLGFLLFNSHPAKVFMGDTGALALGGFVAAEAYLLKMPLFIPIIAFIYLAEVLSVIIQVSCFKLTKGKRVFRMAPIHHHFEQCGFPETKVVSAFTIVTVILCAIALIGV